MSFRGRGKYETLHGKPKRIRGEVKSTGTCGQSEGIFFFYMENWGKTPLKQGPGRGRYMQYGPSRKGKVNRKKRSWGDGEQKGLKSPRRSRKFYDGWTTR